MKSPHRYLPACFALLSSGAAFAGPLLSTDFNKESPWKEASAQSSGQNLKATMTWEPVGTIDEYRTDKRTGALSLSVDSSNAAGAWNAAIVSGPLPVENSETNLGKLTLGFMLSVSIARPVEVVVESLDAGGQATGALAGTIYPAAPDFYQRYSLDLDTLRIRGDGKFDPTAPAIRLSFGISRDAGGQGWPIASDLALHLDNVAYATPAFYVSPEGNDSNDGRTEKTAFANPQAALDTALPGDIVVLMDGTYDDAQQGPTQTAAAVASFRTPGSPAAWITLKNYPGHSPVISTRGHQGVRVAQGTYKTRFGSPLLAYLEVRGLRIRGNGDTAREEFADKLGTNDPLVDAIGIYVRPIDTGLGIYHHLRIADNVITYCTADGIWVKNVDWLSVENNRVENNCWTAAGFIQSGITILSYADFDTVDNATKMLVSGNRSSGNRRYVPWPKAGLYNGNGIILDGNAERPDISYLGRTLVTNNLTFNNGGAGIQLWGSRRIDIVNNTVWKNGVHDLAWGQMGFEICSDIRLINNIIVSQPDRPLDTWHKTADKRSTEIFRANNVYFGGLKPPVPGINDIIADPQFVNPTADPATADFHLKPGSPALNAGRWEPFSPLIDLAGTVRPLNADPSIGAYEK